MAAAITVFLRVAGVVSGVRWPFWMAAFVTAVLAGVAAFRGGTRYLDPWRLPLLLLLLHQSGVFYARLGGDGHEYYILGRSLFFDRDLDLANDFAGFGIEPKVSPEGSVVAHTPIGQGIVWLPALALAHVATLVARAFGADIPADGFSRPYTAAVTLESFLCGALCALLVEAAARRRHGPHVALLVGLAIWVGTPLAFYAVMQPSMSHATSALCGTAFVLLWLRLRARLDARAFLLLGAVAGLMVLVRTQDVVLLLLPLADLLLGRRPGFVRRGLAFLAGPAVALALQAAVWSYLWAGQFVREVQIAGPGGELEIHVKELLFSPRHGLFTWTPVWLLAVLGLVRLFARDRRLAILSLLTFAAAVILNASFHDWWGSEGFGQRRFLGLTALFGLGLGEALALLIARPLLPVAGGLAALLLWNQQSAAVFSQQRAGSRNAAIPLDRMAEAQVQLAFEDWVAARGWMPRALFVLGYDNLRNLWVDGPPLLGRLDLSRDAKDMPFLIGEGWLPPEGEGSLRQRRARGRRSLLHVPLRDPTDYGVTLEGRSLVPGAKVLLSLRVNGREVGRSELLPDWSTASFEVPAAALEAGINSFELTWIEPTGERGPNAPAAVRELRFDWRDRSRLRLEPRG